MKIVTVFLLTFMVITVNRTAAHADELLDEVNSLIRFISIQSDRVSIINQPKYTANFKPIIRKAAEQYGLDPLLIEAIIRVESDFNPYAVSRKGAMGYMQLMPGTAKEIGVSKPFDPYQNIMGGTYYYRLMLNRFRNHRNALYAYNCGPECVNSGRIPGESIRYANNVIREYKKLKRKQNENVK